MSFLRIRLLIILTALLTLGAYGYEVFAHAMPKHESAAEHQHSSSSDKSGCHECTCHCSSPVVENITRVVMFQPRTSTRCDWTRGESTPKAVPVGIDHPPQLA